MWSLETSLDKNWKIYSLRHPDEEKVAYVGMTGRSLNERLKDHLKQNTNQTRTLWVKQIKSSGKLPVIELIEDGLSFEECRRKETFYIRLFKSMGGVLLNRKIGGEVIIARRKHTPEGLANIKKHTPCGWNKGKRLTDEHRSALSAARKKAIKNGSVKVWNDGISKFNVERIIMLKEDGLNQGEIAKTLQCDQSNISRILNNKYKNKMRVSVSKVSTN